jgi:GNAT superfamily N-acetyltransferase
MPLSSILGRPFGQVPWSMWGTLVGPPFGPVPTRTFRWPWEYPSDFAEVHGYAGADDTAFIRREQQREAQHLQREQQSAQMLAKSFLGLEPHEFRGRGHVDDRGGLWVNGEILKDGQRIGGISRTFDADTGYAQHRSFGLRRSEQGSGIGKRILAANVDYYRKHGGKEVNLYANIDVGGYAWAKYGFVSTRGSWDRLRDDIAWKAVNLAESGKLPKHIYEAISNILETGPKAIWKVADITYPVDGQPLGKALLLGTGWDGKLDLTDPAAMERFNAYVGKGKAEAEPVAKAA